MEKVFRHFKEIPPDILLLHDGHRIENAIKCAGLFFFNISLGLNSLPGSCVHDLPRNLIKVHFRPLFLQTIQNLF